MLNTLGCWVLGTCDLISVYLSLYGVPFIGNVSTFKQQWRDVSRTLKHARA